MEMLELRQSVCFMYDDEPRRVLIQHIDGPYLWGWCYDHCETQGFLISRMKEAERFTPMPWLRLPSGDRVSAVQIG